MAAVRPGRSWYLETTGRSPTGVAGAQVVEPSSAGFRVVLTGSWIGAQQPGLKSEL